MEPTPTGDSARPATEGGERGHAELEGLGTADACIHPTEAAAGEVAVRPAAPTAWPALPQRRRTRAQPAGYAEPASTPAGHDPAGRPYQAPDQETLNRLLSGLREI